MGAPRVVAVVQARMGSSRFPGKVLRPLAGAPVLWHVLHRLGKCRRVDEVVVATSTAPGDGPLAEFARGQGTAVVRGSEDDVLSRFLLAGRERMADVVVRVTGDAPLVDPGVIDLLVDLLVREGADLSVGDPAHPVLHEGFEVMGREALERMGREAAGDPVAREHVAAYVKRHPERFRIVCAALPEEHRFRGARVSVDTPADLAFLEEVYRRLGVPAGEASVADVVRLLRTDPALLEINRNVRQKRADEATRHVLVRCDGDGDIGMGHVVRCLALADEMRERRGWGVTFALARGPAGRRLVEAAGFRIAPPPSGAEEEWIGECLGRLRPDALVLDVRTGLDRMHVRGWRERGLLVVDIDDPEEKRLEADLAFYPPVPQVEALSWDGFRGERFAGWEWVPLRRQFAQKPPRRLRGPGETPVVLVTMGGSDPAGMTLFALRALAELRQPFRARVVVGPAFAHPEALRRTASEVDGRFEILAAPPDIAAVMASSDLAVSAFGVTAYELAALGVPAVSLSLTEDHAQSASAFAREGIAVSLGTFGAVTGETLARAVSRLLDDPAARETMGRKASALVDGRGCERIARTIAERIGSGS